MKIGYVIRIVSENNQNMTGFQNHETLDDKYPKIMCALDHLIK